jgi:hypothetical protein
VILAFKLLVTPFFIGSVTLAGRRWGPTTSGLLMGLPLTSGPVSLFLALQYGPTFAAQAAVGTLPGGASVCIVCLAYSLAARKGNWPLAAVVSVSAFLIATAVWNRFSWTLPAAFVLLSVFTHHQHGVATVRKLLRGVVLGSLAFGGFFLVTGIAVTNLSLPLTYALATIAALSMGSLSFYLTY